VPSGTTFRVVLPSVVRELRPPRGARQHRGERHLPKQPAYQRQGGRTRVGHPELEPGGRGGVYNDHPVGVLYDEDVQKWAIYNRDGAPMPEGAAFNVAVYGGVESTR
jgi:hypothetical protein